MKQANAICRQGAREGKSALEATAEERGKPFFDLSPNEMEDVGSAVIVPLYRRILSQLSELEPPSDDASARRFIEEYGNAVEKVEADPSLLFKQQFEKADDAAEEYGLTKCSSF